MSIDGTDRQTDTRAPQWKREAGMLQQLSTVCSSISEHQQSQLDPPDVRTVVLIEHRGLVTDRRTDRRRATATAAPEQRLDRVDLTEQK